MDVRVGLWRKLSTEELMLLNCGVGEDCWESLGLQGDPTSPFWRSALGFLWKKWCSSTLATSREELTHWKRFWCWEGLWTGGEGEDRGWDGWMASLTRWMWVWVNSRSWWWTGRPGVLRFMGLQRVRHDWATDLIWSDLMGAFLCSLGGFFVFSKLSIMNTCYFCNEKKFHRTKLLMIDNAPLFCFKWGLQCRQIKERNVVMWSFRHCRKTGERRIRRKSTLSHQTKSKLSALHTFTDFFLSFLILEANYFTILYWFCHTLTWIRHGCTCVPHPEPPPTSLPIPSLWVIPVHQPQAPCIMHGTLDCNPFQCHSPKPSHSRPLPQSPKDFLWRYKLTGFWFCTHHSQLGGTSIRAYHNIHWIWYCFSFGLFNML